ncbi:type II toxin-antitoxin system RelE/ParE family toxin [Spirosoma sp. KCTC 42546]|uniref:type II toxin-antitoxin system RelE/ParE family toxin n=1 Tax=Spirosoma sp. KCTC 42546 TaxID=2520506 RepID=UPI00115940ED|nr:type II toxin-antitoxin system RelE/ParE family toxin [Spirosoma sp. KCTC 42546]QDK82030.1 type II toxin-antitoxin system RelE/ParE family toxin [Spirosoma sp. KCTC 42546]
MDGPNKFSVVLTEQADFDRDRIIDELIARKPTLGLQWLDAYEYTESLLANNPYIYQEHFLFVRRAHLRKFPYTIYYVIDEINAIILITAVLHQKQDPAIILERLNIEF